MCNLYSLTKGQSAIRDLFSVKHDRAGNLPQFPGIFPDQMAPIVRRGRDGERELVMARWGMPGPPQFGGQPVTNIRNVMSPHWRPWLTQSSRCVVPATSFCEYADTKPRKTPMWFALREDRPLFGLRRPLDALARRARPEERGGRRTPRALRNSHHRRQRRRRAESPEGDARHPDRAGGSRPLAGIGDARRARAATGAPR